MKNRIILVLSIWVMSLMGYGQHGFILEYVGGGSFDKIDLTNANRTNIGASGNSISASDFGPNNVLYAINSGSNEFIQIDTLDGTTSLIGSIIPPAGHIWTGLAYDEPTGIMYGCSGTGTASGEASLHTIDVTTGSYTLVGSQTVATAIACIAIDDAGQMYGLQLAANAKIYLIDKIFGSATLLGSIGQGAAGMGHGMDFCSENQTMYLTTYNSSTFQYLLLHQFFF